MSGGKCVICYSLFMIRPTVCAHGYVRVLPFVFQCFDVEAQRRGDGAHVFSIKLLQDGRLPRVIQTSARTMLKKQPSHIYVTVKY